MTRTAFANTEAVPADVTALSASDGTEISSDTSLEGTGPWPFYARLLADGTRTQGGDGIGGRNDVASLWTGDVLRESAPLFATNSGTRVPVVLGHPDLGEADVRNTVGESVESMYHEPSGSLLVRGEIDDRDVAEQIAHGRADVSPFMARELSDRYDTEADAAPVSKVLGVRDLGIVSAGASSTNRLELGEPPVAFDPATRTPDDVSPEPVTVEALSAAFAASGSEPDVDDGTPLDVLERRLKMIHNRPGFEDRAGRLDSRIADLRRNQNQE